jgi:hypothetical protein
VCTRMSAVLHSFGKALALLCHSLTLLREPTVHTSKKNAECDSLSISSQRHMRAQTRTVMLHPQGPVQPVQFK